MYLGAENTKLSSQQAYLIDALRFTLSISPNSIPCDNSIGIEMSRVSDFEDITRYKVGELLGVIDPQGRLQLVSCTLVRDKVNIIVRFTDTGDTYKVSLS